MHNEICETCGEREYDVDGEPTHCGNPFAPDFHDFSYNIDYCTSCGLPNFTKNGSRTHATSTEIQHKDPYNDLYGDDWDGPKLQLHEFVSRKEHENKLKKDRRKEIVMFVGSGAAVIAAIFSVLGFIL